MKKILLVVALLAVGAGVFVLLKKNQAGNELEA